MEGIYHRINMNESRILDKANYSKKTLDTYEIIAAYFVDIYYNHLYLEAKKMRTDGSVTSITEGYKHTLNAYLQGIENNKVYKKTLMGIQSLFIECGFSTMTFSQCIDRMAYEFVPIDYYSNITNTQKTYVLNMVILQSNKKFIEKTVRKFLSMIIDKHGETDNIRILQDEFIDILIIEREGMYYKFISKNNAEGRSTDNMLVEAMQNEIKKLLSEKYTLSSTNINLKKIIMEKHKLLESKNNTIEELNSIISEKQKIIDDMQSNKVVLTPPSIPMLPPMESTDTSNIEAQGNFLSDHNNSIRFTSAGDDLVKTTSLDNQQSQSDLLNNLDNIINEYNDKAESYQVKYDTDSKNDSNNFEVSKRVLENVTYTTQKTFDNKTFDNKTTDNKSADNKSADNNVLDGSLFDYI